MSQAQGTGPIAVNDALMTSVLAPYRPNCRYVRTALVDTTDAGNARLRAELSVGESCYIDETGHFNAVEFNLCYNQLIYLLLAHCIANKSVPALSSLTLEEYHQRQLPDVLIHDFKSRFERPIDPHHFQGEVEIVRAVARRRFVLVNTRVAFADEHGGASRGEVSLAIVDRDAKYDVGHDAVRD